jgi:hypothetical protein
MESERKESNIKDKGTYKIGENFLLLFLMHYKSLEKYTRYSTFDHWGVLSATSLIDLRIYLLVLKTHRENVRFCNSTEYEKYNQELVTFSKPGRMTNFIVYVITEMLQTQTAEPILFWLPAEPNSRWPSHDHIHVFMCYYCVSHFISPFLIFSC